MKGKKAKPQKMKAEKLALTRRDFLRGAGVAVSGGMLVGGQTLAQAAPAPDTDILGPGSVPITLKINGAAHQLSVEPRVTLLDALRNQLDITGAKRVCDRGTCGACTMIVDGKAIYACSMLAIEAQGHNITTIESFSHGDHLDPVMSAFWDNDAQQCGFCTPGFMMACKEFVTKHPHAKLEEVNEGLSGNICRCGTYHGLKQAALDASKGARSAKA
ncbi:MAG TPA: (2Fe-2S)-binding protein [Terriglobia bacterium]|nr:(2Fe-2S)-binding protein [Terriglobia bacterium]